MPRQHVRDGTLAPRGASTRATAPVPPPVPVMPPICPPGGAAPTCPPVDSEREPRRSLPAEPAKQRLEHARRNLLAVTTTEAAAQHEIGDAVNRRPDDVRERLRRPFR